MPAFIEECRYEWKRLGVPDSMADEMAAELESDLAEAEADGVSAAEVLGEAIRAASPRPGPANAASSPSHGRRGGGASGRGSLQPSPSSSFS